MSLKGYEQEEPILKYLRAKGLNIPHLDDAYELWNADKNKYLIFVGESEREKFGTSLYATNLKIQSSSYFLDKVKVLFEPKLLLSEPYLREDSRFDYYLKRYSYLGAFFWSIFGALDSLAFEISVIKNFEKEGNFDPKRCNFKIMRKLLHKIHMGCSKQKPKAIKRADLVVDIFKKEQMFGSKNWYDENVKHRHLHTHVPFFVGVHVQNEGIFLPKDPEKRPYEIINPIVDANKKGDVTLANKLKKELLMKRPVHTLTEELFNNCKKFIGNLYLALRKTYEPEIIKLCVQTN